MTPREADFALIHKSLIKVIDRERNLDITCKIESLNKWIDRDGAIRFSLNCVSRHKNTVSSMIVPVENCFFAKDTDKERCRQWIEENTK